MKNTDQQERRKLILGTLLSLILIAFVLFFAVANRQSYTSKAAGQSGGIGMPVKRRQGLICGSGLCRIMMIQIGNQGQGRSDPNTADWKKWSTGKPLGIC